jgi:hypothetical protein
MGIYYFLGLKDENLVMYVEILVGNLFFEF